ncbi:hypothetical protein [Paraburkholderia panacisoli]|nr:hypothetical protein [Paraburkholderia panacisoli]
MSLIATFLTAHLTAIISWLVGMVGVLFGVFRHQQAQDGDRQGRWDQ